MQKVYTEKISVRMFGDFSITINGNTLQGLKGRTKRVWLLIQYLLANRFREVPLDSLIGVLWSDRMCGDPVNALKNLVYRARTLLRDLSGGQDLPYILFTNDTYAWNNKYPCTIDSEQFLNYWKQGENRSSAPQARLESYKRAIAVYRGKFLPKSAYNSWVISASARYAALYRQCVAKACGLLIGMHRFEDMIRICETALNYEPLELSFHKLLIFASVNAGYRNQALESCNYAAELFYRELGVDVSDSLRPLYRRFLNGSSGMETDLSTIKNDLKESTTAEGAFFCDYDVFKSIYRMQARLVLRTGQPIFIILFTLVGEQSEQPPAESEKGAAARLKTAILVSLRKGDIVTSYSATQFIAMLPLITYENACMVSERILRKFRFDYRKGDVRILTKIDPVDSAEEA